MEDNVTQYWIVVNRTHAGPYTVEQLKELGIARDTYAWHRGLPQWVAASEIPELAAALWPAEAEVVATETAAEPVRLTPPVPPAPARSMAAMAAPVPAPQAVAVEAPEGEECPPTYLWWAIVVTVLFSLPFGVVAIVFAGQVKKQWRDGDFAGARRSAERVFWFSIIGFVTGLMMMPFQIVALLL